MIKIKEKTMKVGIKGNMLINNKIKSCKNLTKCKKGENFVETGIKILIAVVIGALILAGLYSLFGDVILPNLEERIKEMFDFKG